MNQHQPFEMIPNGNAPRIPPSAIMVPQQAAQAMGMMALAVGQTMMTVNQMALYMMKELKDTKRELRMMRQQQGGMGMGGMPMQGQQGPIVFYQGQLDVYGRPMQPPTPDQYCSPQSQLGPNSPMPYKTDQGGFW